MNRRCLRYIAFAMVVSCLGVAAQARADDEDGDAAAEPVTESSKTSWKGKITPSDDEGHRSDVRIRPAGGSNGLIMIIGGASYDVIEFKNEENALNWEFDFSGSVFSCNLLKDDGSDAYVGECKGKHVKFGKLRIFEQGE